MARRAGAGRRWRRRAGAALGLVLGIVVLWAGWEAWHWPHVGDLRRHDPATTAFIERARAAARAAGRPAQIDWRWVPYAQISPHLKRAVLVAEDINFFSHRGFDVAELRRAVEAAWEDGELPRGASTLTQQLAKNLWLSPARSPLRKGREAILTWQLERTLGKRRILELYLNVVELGPGCYGAEAAARRYFSKPASALEPEEAAQLAASLPSPGTWHPGSLARGYRTHVRRVLQRMERAEFLWRLI